MNKHLTELVDSLEKIRSILVDVDTNDGGYDKYGWNLPHLTSTQLDYYIQNEIVKIEAWEGTTLPKGLETSIPIHNEKVKELITTLNAHYTDEKGNLAYVINVIINTLHVIFNDIDHELFSYEYIDDKKLLPRSLSNRLRGVKTKIEQLNESSTHLKQKIQIINEAHETAESLPTDLESLKEGRNDLLEITSQAKIELEKTKQELQSLVEKSSKLLAETQVNTEKVEEYLSYTQKYSHEAKLLAEKCDDSLQITTTQGLAAGFDQKAKELKSSITIWIIGLLIALVSGAYIGSIRVDALTDALSQDLTAGQAVLHTIMSVFSIGGSLWLAWISTQQITQRFKLAEDYSYKATVAKSFTGFKKFAERFGDETEERLFNSTLDRFDEMPLRLLNGKDYNSPWHEFTDSESFREALRMFPNLAKEAGKFATKADIKSKLRTKSSNNNQFNSIKPANDQVSPSEPKEQETT